jgi:hypothetical protein
LREIHGRAHDPQWAFSPLSGEGARLKGGRFNPIGQAALYLALTIEGMFLEMGHGLAYRFDPLTICSYDVDVADIVDLRSEAGRKKVPRALEGSCLSLGARHCRRPGACFVVSRGETPPRRCGGIAGAVIRTRHAA